MYIKKYGRREILLLAHINEFDNLSFTGSSKKSVATLNFLSISIRNAGKC
jgi:hypothetical protein